MPFLTSGSLRSKAKRSEASIHGRWIIGPIEEEALQGFLQEALPLLSTGLHASGHLQAAAAS
jgi:hypothetical protein